MNEVRAEAQLETLLSHHAERLRAAGVPSPDVDARLLAAHVLGRDVRTGEPLPSGVDRERLARLVERRARREPLQHLVGGMWFRHVHVACRPGVFIPRPETEILAGFAVDACRRRGGASVIEPCVGSGAVTMSLLAEAPRVEVVATDASEEAVALARHNVERLTGGQAGVPGPTAGSDATVLLGDLFAPVDEQLRGRVDVVVANPPYMPAADRVAWEPEVADHDPVTATVGGVDGHEVVRRVLDEARGWLAPGGELFVEIDERRGAETVALARSLGFDDVAVAADLTGADRVLRGRWLGGPPDPASGAGA